jgi:hypothetical protein|tara:strand:+ start:1968 stop:3107 length:1140 start_codon:yes stop_codon:yes gene_type:complete
MKSLIWYRSKLFWVIDEKLSSLGYNYHKENFSCFLENMSMTRVAPIHMEQSDLFGLNTKVINNNVPAYKEVKVDDDLISLLEKKAIQVCSTGIPIDLLWSGGIDSTATLLILKDVVEKDQLNIILSTGSIEEHPKLYQELVKHLPHRISYDKNIRSLIKKDHITINANVADPLYGGFLGHDKSAPHKFLDNAGETHSIIPIEFRVLPWYKFMYTWQQQNFQHLAGYVHDEVIIEDDYVPSCVSLFDDTDVLQWFVNKYIRKELPVLRNDQELNKTEYNEFRKVWEKIPTEGRLCQDIEDAKNIPRANSYTEMKIELRDYIAKETGDKEYAYGKLKVASYIHGQADMYNDSCKNIAVCSDGTIIRRSDLNDINPFDYLVP